MSNNIDNIVTLADICEVLQGKNVDKKKTNERGEGLPIVVGASDLVQGRFVPKRWCKEKINAPVFSEEGDILISVVGTLGKMGVNADGPAVLSKHVCALRPKQGVSRQYLMAVISRLLLDAIPDTADDVVLGFQNKVDIDVLKKIRFTLPALFIQEWIVKVADIRAGERTLEPSAGQGNIAQFMPTPDCIELDPKNRAVLIEKGFRVIGDDFMTFEPSEPYDVIVMNPPFCKRQDALHILKAISIAKRKVVAIASYAVMWRTDGPYKELRDVVEHLGGYISELPDKSFKESGTMVKTALVVVEKTL